MYLSDDIDTLTFKRFMQVTLLVLAAVFLIFIFG